MMPSSIELEAKSKSSASQKKDGHENENDNLCNSRHNDGSGAGGRFPDGPDTGAGHKAGSCGNNCSGFDLEDGRDSDRGQDYEEGEEAFGES